MPGLREVGTVDKQKEEGAGSEGGGRYVGGQRDLAKEPRSLGSQEAVASDYFVVFVLSEGSAQPMVQCLALWSLS